MTAPPLEIVAAVAANGVIGRGGQLAWHLPDDLRHFKSLTLGHTIIMGRRTFDSIGRALPGRRNIVVSTTLGGPPAAGVELVSSLDDALRRVAGTPGPAFVIGGAVLYAAATPRARVMHLTELDEPIDGDVVFPQWDRAAWRLTNDVRHERDEHHLLAFHVRRYERIDAAP